MAKILVTGGAGYIGSHFCKTLSHTKHTHIVLDSLERGHQSAVKWGELKQGSLLDMAFLEEVFAAYKPDAVVHFAAYALVGESVSDPAIYYKNNVQGTFNLLDTMRKHAVKPIVFSSSCAVYGIPKHEGRLSEDHPFGPISPYGATKAMMEQALSDYGAYGIRSAALRYFNAAGADAGGEIGEAHFPETHALPLMLRAALGKGTFKCFGTDYRTPDGTAIRDYVHVDDIAQAHVKALDHLLAGGDSLAVNLGTGQGTSVKALLAAVEQITGSKVPVEYVERRAGDPPALVADPSLAALLLDWKAKDSDLEHIVRTAWLWHLKEPA